MRTEDCKSHLLGSFFMPSRLIGTFKGRFLVRKSACSIFLPYIFCC